MQIIIYWETKIMKNRFFWNIICSKIISLAIIKQYLNKTTAFKNFTNIAKLKSHFLMMMMSKIFQNI
jgi:hypothetical protein